LDMPLYTHLKLWRSDAVSIWMLPQLMFNNVYPD
jgi:hypothetical protein